MNSVILLLGTNIGNRLKNLKNSIILINQNAGRVLIESSIYETEPWGFSSDLPFYNMAISIETKLSPTELIKQLNKVESGIGRERSNKNGYENRIIDIDIISFGNIVIDTPELNIPHPRMHLRKFTLLPIMEIAPDWIHPTLNKSISNLLKECEDKCTATKI
jgi:2-amino-4-hydroxy-6-hydroxymethyldihydropteridine diphosphokinase